MNSSDPGENVPPEETPVGTPLAKSEKAGELTGVTETNVLARALEPTPYHRAVVDYLRREEGDLWNWFASVKARAQHASAFRHELLKSTYRLDAEGHPDLMARAEEVKGSLGLNIPITLYQAQQNGSLNAALYFIPGEGHIVFSGPTLSLLQPDELASVIAHELAHYQLWSEEGGVYLVADRVLHAITEHGAAAPSHGETARRFCLQTEIYADRGSLMATGKIHAVVAGLVKMQTGLQQVSGESYLKQAEEIFSGRNITTQELTHPETFIRARALQRWAAKDPGTDDEIGRMIRGEVSMDGFDLLDQERFTRLTRRLLEQLLRPKWFQSEAVLGHARLFFPDFRPAELEDGGVENELESSDAKLKDYLAYLLLDFAGVDPDLEEVAAAAGLEWSRKLGVEANFEKLLAKELKCSSKDLKKLKSNGAELLRKAEEEQ